MSSIKLTLSSPSPSSLKLILVAGAKPARVHQDGSIHEQTARDGHDARSGVDNGRMGEDEGESESGRLDVS